MHMLTLEAAEAVASIVEEDSSHTGLPVVVCMHCWLLSMSGVEAMKDSWGLRPHARAKHRLLPV